MPGPISEEEEFEFRRRAELERAGSQPQPAATASQASPQDDLWWWQRAQQSKPGPAVVGAGLREFGARTLGIPVDTGENLMNLSRAAVGTAAIMGGRTDLAPPVESGTALGSEWFRQKLQTRNPLPEDRTARLVYEATALGPYVPGAFRQSLLGSIGGSAAKEFLGPEWEAPVALGSALVGRKTGPSVNQARAARAQEFSDIGVQPSAGMVTDSPWLQGSENLLSKFPGGTGIMSKYLRQFQSQMGRAVGTDVDVTQGGRAIERGITRPGGFLERTRAQWKSVDDALAAKVKASGASGVDPVNTKQALIELTSPVKGAEQTTGALVNPKMRQLLDNINKDQAKNGSIPYDALRAIRTRVGEMMDDALVRDVPQGELRSLYAALTKDIEAAAKSAGAEGLFARQNKLWTARQGRVEEVLTRVIGRNRTPEEIFRTFAPKSEKEVTRVRAVLRSLDPSERKIVGEALANDLGRAKSSHQGAEGDVFSTETFLTNWDKVNPKLRSIIWPDDAFRANITKIANISDRLRSGEGYYKNPSGTAGSFAAYAVYFAPFIAAGQILTTGNVKGALGTIGGAAGSAAVANAGAKLITNPKFVAWLAKAPTASVDAMTLHLARLTSIYNSMDSEERKALATYQDAVSSYVDKAGLPKGLIGDTVPTNEEIPR